MTDSIFAGIRMPVELVREALTELGIDISSVKHIAEDHGLFYTDHHKYVSALGRVVHLEDGQGRVDYYLKRRDNPLSLSEAKLTVELLLVGGGKRVKLFKALDVVFQNGREAKPIYVFVEVADLK